MHGNKSSERYRKAGVDVTAGYKAVELIGKHILRTNTKGVFSEIGGFGGLFKPDLEGMKEPVLVSGTDGVGTKLKLAFLLDKHDTIGTDCVAMCVNDIICAGATPMFFLDYIACDKNIPEKIEKIVSGIADGCRESGMALIGGETAEMPGFYKKNEYDIAGFAVGIVDKKDILDKENVEEGDVLIALASSGVHSNGFSLVRKIFEDELDDRDLLEKLLTPTRIYVKSILSLLKEVEVKSIAHITGGGFFENIPRALPAGLSAKIDKNLLKIPEIFSRISEKGKIPESEMYATFNMGVGMVVIVSKNDVDKSLELLGRLQESAYVIGEIVSSHEGVIL
ncbi:MAG: phosphoribosylformylglycinamidine cyclo-ligase [Clostridiales bacterium]|nr:MAG: phosphoribosylformylglycinamidine cyclo-ligase [Clostridiales bacterium]